MKQDQGMPYRPFVSIGITTFNRVELLKECLASVLGQSFGDYEVLVGNNHQGAKLSAEVVGINDPRITYINHPEDLGHTKNANYLLSVGRGRYFTWLNDDDAYEPGFLEAVHAAVVSGAGYRCVFTSFRSAKERPSCIEKPDLSYKDFSGREFLRKYLNREIKTIGCYAVFEADFLRSLGGLKHFGKGNFTVYSDNLFAIQAASLPKVAFCPENLVYFRAHAGSFSNNSKDIELYVSAQEEYFEHCLKVLTLPSLSEDLSINVLAMIRWFVRDIKSVLRRSGGAIPSSVAKQYAGFLLKASRHLTRPGHRLSFLASYLSVLYRFLLSGCFPGPRS